MTSIDAFPGWIEENPDPEGLEDNIADEQDRLDDDTRLAVLDRDGWQCQHCGEADPDQLTLHHVTYRSQGGTDAPENLCVLCWSCHREIHDKFLWVKRIAGNWYFKRTP